MARYRLRCTECGRECDPDAVAYTCPRCFSAWKPGTPLRGVLRVEFADPGDFPALQNAGGPGDQPPDQRRFVGLLPINDPSLLPDLPVGPTPLHAPRRLRAHLKMPRLYLKDDTCLPTGSLKDRASSLVVAKARELGRQRIATASTGNAATALAGMCAASGAEAIVLVPAGAPPAKLVQMLQYGAQVIRIDGTYDEAFGLCLQAGEELGWYNRSTAYNPYTIEGKKTVAFEIWEQLGHRAPDAVVVPVGDGVILAGVEKGFADLERFGLIARPPRLIAVQAEGSAAVVAAYRGLPPLERAETIAGSIRVAAPANGRWALSALRRTAGAGLTVGDGEILDAVGLLARQTGVFAEPAGAAALAGARIAAAQGILDPEGTTVLLVTGAGLKDPAAAAKGVRLPAAIDANLSAVTTALQRP